MIEDKNLQQFMATLPEEIQVVILTDEPMDYKENVAYVTEHYNLATVDPARIALRNGREKKPDLTELCHLFLAEKKFGVYQTSNELPKEICQGAACEADIEICGNLQNEVKEVYGEVPPFFQMLMVKSMLPFLRKNSLEKQGALMAVVKEWDDDILCECPCISEDELLALLCFKYGREIEKEFVYRSGKLRFDNLSVLSLKEIPFVVEEVKVTNKKLKISGQVMMPLRETPVDYWCMDNKNKRYELVYRDEGENFFLGEKLSTRKSFEVKVPFRKEGMGIRFMYRYGEYQARIKMEFGSRIPMKPDELCGSCGIDGLYLRVDKRILSVAPLKLTSKLKLFLK